ncbi:MAG: hypothetical protein M1820_010175 [Bogoriella megaspora]|nr:MAG: hypothetical protein M1820_010175 [Bogoriella megaspora]
MATISDEPEIPKSHKAIIYDQPGTISTKVVEVETPEPGPGEILVRFVCQSDQSVMLSEWQRTVGLPPVEAGFIGGHEGVGVIRKMGPGNNNSRLKVGNRVGIKLAASICGSCGSCLMGLESRCRSSKAIGIRNHGTFQQYMVTDTFSATPIPDGLDSAAAAPMLCAGITVYTALKRTDAKPGQWVVVMGAGGGLGHIACQLGSRGLSFRIIGVDHGSKEDLVLETGAEAFLDYTKFDDKTIGQEVARLTGGGATAVVACTSSNTAYSSALHMLGLGGTLVCVGIPEGDPREIQGLHPYIMIGKHLTVRGVMLGNRRDAIEMMDFAARGVVKPHYRLEKMENLSTVFQEMSDARLMGRVVLDLQ